MPSFEAMFRKYFERIYHFSLLLTHNAHEADELTEKTFFKALKSIDRFEGRSDPVTWLCSIAKNEYFNQVQRNRENAFPPDSFVFDRPADSPEDALSNAEKSMRIHRHLHSLEEPYREVFTLRVFGELKFSQIASLFSRTESWARVTFYRAKCMLQEKIKEDEHEKP